MALIPILKGAHFSYAFTVAVPDDLTEAQLITELTGATATAVLDEVSTKTAISGGTCTAAITAASRLITISLTDVQTAALTAHPGELRMDLRYTTSGGTKYGPKVTDSFCIVENPWE